MRRMHPDRGMRHGLSFFVAALAMGAVARGGGPPPAMPDLLASQVTVEVRDDRTQSRFRGTVLDRDGDLLTVVTAAHCLSAAQVGCPARVTVAGTAIRGVVASVVWNPAYRPKITGHLHGPDSAVARFRVDSADPRSAAALGTIRPARGPIEYPFPDPGGRTIVVRAIDGDGIEHAIRAGNHMNPRWLEWGPGYFPKPGDSGGGVFWLRQGPDGQPEPVLIGAIVGHDARGGGAALVSLDQRWLAEALADKDRPPEPAIPRD
ncbi:hypothetical protein TA3x_005336 [Tundrisphaera sp. TA3]|uniref:hypothetical protein n=1 Tax=Tundrisphaera sp. TA3 TaxID=3435775 RepID=UPI003EBF42F0